MKAEQEADSRLIAMWAVVISLVALVSSIFAARDAHNAAAAVKRSVYDRRGRDELRGTDAAFENAHEALRETQALRDRVNNRLDGPADESR